MNLLLKWFKSEKQRELEALQIEEQKLKNQLLRVTIERSSVKSPENEILGEKPYKSIRLVNDILVITFDDGQIITKPLADRSLFEKVKSAQSKDDILNMIDAETDPTHRRNVNKSEMDLKGIEMLKSTGDFIFDKDSVIMNITGRTIPEMLFQKFVSFFILFFTSTIFASKF